MQHIRNLVFEAGGVKGIGYCGALSELACRGILGNCVRFAGTSAGAITAWLCAYYKDDVNKITCLQRGTDFKEFADTNAIITGACRVRNWYGWHKGDRFFQWTRDITKERFNKDHITFQELFDETGHDLVIFGCNASKGKTILFSKDTTPAFFVERAIRISMSIPIFFRSVFIPDGSVDTNGMIVGNPVVDKNVKHKRDIFVDGGVLDMYPIQVFDVEPYICDESDVVCHANGKIPRTYNKSTLGFRVDSDKELRIETNHEDGEDAYEGENFVRYAFALAELLHVAANKRHLDEYDWHRTIRINTLNISGYDFQLDKGKQDTLICQGKVATKSYLNEYSSCWHNYVG